MPKSTQRWRTNLSSSSNEPSSNSRLMRSRAVSLPALCSRSRRSGPPPASASALRRSNSSRRPCCRFAAAAGIFLSGTRLSGWRFFCLKNADREMGGNPDGSEQKNDAEDNFRGKGQRALQRRGNRGDTQGSVNQNIHRGQCQCDGKQRGDDRGEKLFHKENREAKPSTMGKSLAQTLRICLSASPTNRLRPESNRLDWRDRT